MSEIAYRAVLSHTEANQSKLDKVASVLPLWREGLKVALEEQVLRIQNGEKIGWLDTKTLSIPGDLQPSQRYWKNIVNQVNNDLKSWRALISQAAKPLIFQLELPEGAEAEQEKELKRLFSLNKAGLWYQDARLTAILESLLEGHPLPCYDETRTMLMDRLIAEFQESRSESGEFKRWLRVSIPGEKPVLLPLRENPYLESYPGTEQLCQFTVDDWKGLRLRIVKRFEVDPITSSTDRVVGLDWGLKSLLTTSEGRQYGRRLYGWLLERDTELTELSKVLKKNGVKLNSSKRYRALNKRVRDYVENEVGRIVNLLTAEELDALVVEELDFRGGGLSKKLNRVISRAGRKVLRQRLADASQVSGVAIVKVAAPYSSQECSGCGYVSSQNRRSQSVFCCKFCGLRLNADVNAARIVKGRRSVPSLSGGVSKETVLEVLDERFQARWGLSFRQYQERSAVRPRSRAKRASTSLTNNILCY